MYAHNVLERLRCINKRIIVEGANNLSPDSQSVANFCKVLMWQVELLQIIHRM